jgi:DNA-binding Lrp family transcriptional regulator
MDKIDIGILRELMDDARLSYNEIARRISVSVGTVAMRIRNLEKQGVIKGYSVILDAEKLGYNVNAIIDIVISKGKLRKVEEEVANNPNVYGVYDVTGASDAIVVTRFKNRQELSDFVKSLLSSDYVDRTLTHFVLGTVKEDFRIPV